MRDDGRPGRVLVLTNMWPTEDAPTRGGFVHDQVRDLERAAGDWTFDVLAIDARRGRMDYLRGLAALRKRVAGGAYDAVHAHYGLTGAVGVMQRTVPVVVTFHGSDLYIPWQRRVSSVVHRAAAASIFVSDRLRQVLGQETAGHAIPCGVDTALFRPLPREDVRRRLGVPEHGLLVVFPGDPGRDVKNHPLFQATIEVLPESLRSRVRPVPLTGLRHEQVPALLSAADAVLVTSRYEGAGNVAKEAVACGTPVVSVDVGDIRRTIEGLPGCAIAAPDAGALAAALEATLRGDGAGRPGFDGRARLEALGVDAASVADRVLDVYRSVRRGGARG